MSLKSTVKYGGNGGIGNLMSLRTNYRLLNMPIVTKDLTLYFFKILSPSEIHLHREKGSHQVCGKIKIPHSHASRENFRHTRTRVHFSKKMNTNVRLPS